MTIFFLLFFFSFEICCSNLTQEPLGPLYILPSEVLLNIASFMQEGRKGHELLGTTQVFAELLEMWQEDRFKIIGERLASRDLRRSIFQYCEQN